MGMKTVLGVGSLSVIVGGLAAWAVCECRLRQVPPSVSKVAWREQASGDADMRDFARLLGETDDSARILRAVASAGRGGVVWFPRGEYRIARPLVVANGVSLSLHKSARLVATAAMDYVLDYSGGVMDVGGGRPGADHNLFVRGGEIDGKGQASCLRVRNFRKLEIADLTLRNGRLSGLKLGAKEMGRLGGGYEAIVKGVYCICDRPGLAGNVGIDCELSDCHFADDIVVDHTVGIRLRNSSCRLARCHVWGGMVRDAAGQCEYLKDSVAFDLDNWDTLLDACYADTAKVGFRVRGHARIVNSAVFNNYEVFKMDNPLAVEHLDGMLTVANCHFVKTSPHARLYHGSSRFPLFWRDNTQVRFTAEEMRSLETKRADDAREAAKGGRP